MANLSSRTTKTLGPHRFLLGMQRKRGSLSHFQLLGLWNRATAHPFNKAKAKKIGECGPRAIIFFTEHPRHSAVFCFFNLTF